MVGLLVFVVPGFFVLSGLFGRLVSVRPVESGASFCGSGLVVVGNVGSGGVPAGAGGTPGFGVAGAGVTGLGIVGFGCDGLTGVVC